MVLEVALKSLFPNVLNAQNTLAMWHKQVVRQIYYAKLFYYNLTFRLNFAVFNRIKESFLKQETSIYRAISAALQSAIEKQKRCNASEKSKIYDTYFFVIWVLWLVVQNERYLSKIPARFYNLM